MLHMVSIHFVHIRSVCPNIDDENGVHPFEGVSRGSHLVVRFHSIERTYRTVNIL